MQRISDNALQPASAIRHDYHARVARGTTLEDVLNPEFWANVSKRMSEAARIEVLSEDGELDVDLRVVSIRRPEGENPIVHVRPLRIGYCDKVEEVAESPGMYEAKWGGPVHKWRVELGSQIVEKGYGTKILAEAEAARLNSMVSAAA
jgi:hypothetical protein